MRAPGRRAAPRVSACATRRLGGSPPAALFGAAILEPSGPLPYANVRKSFSGQRGIVALPPERVRAQLAAQRGGADAVFDEAGRRVAVRKAATRYSHAQQ